MTSGNAQASEKPLFMSEGHVDIMNRLLAADPASRAEAAKLDRTYVLVYRLINGPGGPTVWWQMRFDPALGIRFALDEPSKPGDLTLEGEWAAMMRFMRATKEGRATENPLRSVGDEKLMERLGAAFAAAQQIATIPTSFPEI